LIRSLERCITPSKELCVDLPRGIDREVAMMRTIAVALAAFWLVSFGVFAQGSTTGGTSSGASSGTSTGTSDTTKSETKKAKKKSKKAKKKAAKTSGSEETPGGGARSGETPK
jgi:hypothetical protein